MKLALTLVTIFFWYGVRAQSSDVKVNRALNNSMIQMQELAKTHSGDELKSKINSIPLLSGAELTSLTSEQQLELRDLRIEQKSSFIAKYAPEKVEVKEVTTRRKNPAFNIKDRDDIFYVKDENGDYVETSGDNLFAESKAPANAPVDVKENLSKFYQEKGIDDNFLSKMMDKKMKEKLAEMMKQNPLSMMSKGELEDKIMENSKNTALGRVLEKNPKLKVTLVEFAHDKDALPGLVSIINKPKKMRYYGFCLIAILVGAFIFNLMNTKGSLIKRIGLKLALGATTFTLNISAFYFFFHEELAPTVAVLKRVLL